MQSESRWQRRTINSRGSMMEDDTVGMSREESPIKKWITAGAIAVGGVAAYKSGALKPLMKQMMEYADNYQPFVKEGRQATQNWLNGNHLKEGVRGPKFSAVRNKVNIEEAIKNKYYRSQVMKDTSDDIGTLFKNIQERSERVDLKSVKESKRKLGSVEIAKWAREIEVTSQKELKNLNQTQASSQVRNTMVERLLETQRQSSKEALLKEKRSGYRNLTMGDIFELGDDNKLQLKSKYLNQFDLEDKTSQFSRLMNDVMNADVKVGDDYKKLYETDKWKNLKVDSNMFIDSQGKMVDTRHVASEMNGFVQSMSKNFQIPFIGMNPLRLFGVDTLKFQESKFGLIGKNTINPMITKRAGHNATVGNVFGDAPVFFADGNVYKFEDGKKTATLIDKGFKFYNMDGMQNLRHGLVNELHNLHIISGLDYYDYEEFTSADGFGKNLKGKIGRTLDIGRQDKRGTGVSYDNSGITKYFTPDYYVDKMAEFFGGKVFNTTKEVISENFTHGGKTNIVNLYGHTQDDVRMFVGVKKGYKMKDAWSSDSDVTWTQFGRQFVTGRKTLDDGTKVLDEDVTAATLGIFNTINRASQSLAVFGLDLSNDSKQNSVMLMKNLITKRFLPMYGAYQAYEFMNYLTEFDLDEDGNPTNITKLGADAVKNVDLGYHRFKDAVGITAIAKEMAPLLPGAEQLPVSSPLDLTSTTEERADWYEDGMVEVRKGRWWGMGNTPFSGGKIEYWQPNWYRRVQADVRFSDSMYGSRKEYFDNAWFSNPIRHFITDPYHYDKKHYQDRPYLITSGAFSQVPIFGPTLDATVGKIIKPRKRMHEEYWNGGWAGSDSNGVPDQTLNADLELAMATSIGGSYSGLEEAEEGEQLVSYVTPSGAPSVVGIGANEPIGLLNHKIKSSSLQKATAVNQRVGLDSANPIRPNRNEPLSMMPNGAELAFTETFDQVTNLQGMIGFMTKAFVTGDLDVNKQVIESSDYAYSFNRGFWDANVGGSGGELMEIFRRFIPKRRNDVDWYNPIRNTQPDWMPGSDYFTDFKHGDPYSKIAKGEMRLAGEGYERMWGIDAPTLNIGSSYLGKSKTDMIKHFLNQDQSFDEGMQDILETGNDIHAEVEQKLMESGVAIDIEGKIQDKENGILGFYDVKLNDPTSSNGVALMDVKTIGSKGFEEIKKTGQPKLANQMQVNYYLWATGNTQSNGYLYYINRDNPEEREVIKFKFDEKMLQQSFDTLNAARAEVLKGLDEGTVGRGELYSHLDRFRILADVAPYSKEFTEQKTLMSTLDLTEEERQEVSEINARVTAQKEPMRIYDYRFKTANVRTETVTIKKVLDKNTFIVKEHPNNPIKLAGVTVVDAKNKDGVSSEELISKYIAKGKRIRISYDADPLNQISNDSLKTIRASVVSKGVNVNRKMIDEGVGNEKVDDYSPAAVHARFSALQRSIGSAWESVAHLHTPVNTKLLQVRSGYEAYKRREVYGKDFQRWENPVSDFLAPLINENIERGVVTGVLGGVFFGSLFGSTKYGRLIGSAIGVSTYVVGKSNQMLYEAREGKKWIPKVRREERGIEEYMDMLKYVKNRKLYEQYKLKAFKEDHFDVERYIRGQKSKGKTNKEEVRDLEKKKKKLKMLGNLPDWDLPFTDKTLDDFRDERVKKLTGQINEIGNDRKIHKLSDNALKAIYYYNESEKTMYGYDRGEPLQNILAALPKRDRQYMKYFMDAPEEERGKILEIAPEYMKRALQSVWGYKVDAKQDIVDYFSNHVLPNEQWAGWDENVSLDDVRVKLIKKAGLDFSEFDVWDDQVQSANEAGEIPLPKVNHRENPTIVAQRLKGLLSRQGLEDVKVQVKYSAGKSSVDMGIESDVRGDITEALRNNY